MKRILPAFALTLILSLSLITVTSCGNNGSANQSGNNQNSDSGPEQLTPSQGLEFTSFGNNTCYVSDIGTCRDTHLVIPATAPNGEKVTAIGEDAFEDCPEILKVTIPSSVIVIKSGAFEDCSGLTSVTIKNGVTSIGEYAFYSCTSLKSIVIPESITTIGENAFGDCPSLTSVTFKDTAGWRADTLSVSPSDLKIAATAANLLTTTHSSATWVKASN